MVSVIVPIYNVEEYLAPCVESILRQTYKDLEVILVDDGSPDNCPAICDRFAEQDSRIYVIHKQNGGLSDARNAGLKAAKGDFFFFVDSDDMLPEYSIEWMLKCLEHNHADMVIAGFERFDEKTLDVFFSTCPAGNETVTVMNRAEAMHDFYRDGCQAWAVLYTRKIHEGIFFPYGEINEDEAVIFHILERCETVVATDKVVYQYRNRENSITTSIFTEKKLAWYRHCADNLEWIKSHHPELEPLAAKRLCGSVLWSLREIALSDKDFMAQRLELLTDIKVHYKYYCSLDLNRAERLRLWAVRWLPFSVYRSIERARQKKYLRRNAE